MTHIVLYEIFTSPDTKPIVEASGHVYEGTVITRWLSCGRQGQLETPRCRQRLLTQYSSGPSYPPALSLTIVGGIAAAWFAARPF